MELGSPVLRLIAVWLIFVIIGILVFIMLCPKAGRALLFCLPHKKEAKKVTTCEKPGLILRAGHYPLASGQGLPVFRTTRGQANAQGNPTRYVLFWYGNLRSICILF